ncbi:MAG TPA: hypothetical protein EYO79_09750 [Candidatus Marinimicrobia bacterium]|jgi:hypothetical protein|nr:hypothetical protein [Candidatus Neomarinimicrobiota bacterium]
MIVYLSGAMEQATDEGEQWRSEMTEWLKTELDHDVINPVVSSQLLVEEHEAYDYSDWKFSNPKRFVEFIRKAIDLDLDNIINKSDYIICLWDYDVMKGGGTHGEVTMAYYKNVPVYLVNQVPIEDLSGWIMSCSTDIFNTFTELKSHLIKTYSF